MPTFTLREFERTGVKRSCELRILGKRQLSAATAMDGKHWLSRMIKARQIEGDRFYQFESSECISEHRLNSPINIAFYLFPDGRLCPLRIWSRSERLDQHWSDPEWTVDFEGIPGWSLVASLEPRWRRIQNVPVERSWMGRSWRDWEKRDCWVLEAPSTPVAQVAA